MTSNTSDYWRRRAEEERVLADRAETPVIARIRNTLADCTEERASNIDALNVPRRPAGTAPGR